MLFWAGLPFRIPPLVLSSNLERGTFFHMYRFWGAQIRRKKWKIPGTRAWILSGMLLGEVLLAGAQATPHKSPIDKLTRPDKTELTDAFSNVAVTGGDFGLPWMWWWHRINAGWGTVRPEVARLVVYDERSHQLMWVQGGERTWMPDHLHQSATLNDIIISEDKSVLGDSVADVLQIRNGSQKTRPLKLYFLGYPEPHSPGNPDSSGLFITFDRAANSLRLIEKKNYGRHYLPGVIEIDQSIGSSLPISGWAVGTIEGDLEKFLGRDLGMGAFINDANLRKYGTAYSGNRFTYGFQINLTLAPGETKDLTLATTIGTSDNAVMAANANLISHAAEMITAKDAEWRRYFENSVPRFRSPDEKLNRLWYYVWYVLRSNAVRHGKAVTADFTVPSKYGYWGCYIWDSAFHALGQMHLQNPGVAEDALRAILSVQYPNGFVPVNSGADDVEVNTPSDGTYDLDPHDVYRYSETSDPYISELEYRSPQPHQWGISQKTGIIEVKEKTMLPILGIAAWQVYLTTGDRAFLAEMYDRLSRYDDWLWRRRNTGDGLVVWYDPEESGWDNATRLLPLPVKTVDASTMAYMLRRMLSDSARVLGRENDAAQYEQRAEVTARSINQEMWDERTGFYYDLSMDGRRRTEKSPAGFVPLMAGIVSVKRAARLTEHLRNPKEFASAAPVPTLSVDDPGYDPSMWGWNGPSWIPSNWLVMESFARAGMIEDSNRLMKDMEGMMSKPDGWPGAYEQYNSQTGIPFGVADYSWSGAVDDYLTRWMAGVQPDVPNHTLLIAPHLFAGWKWFELDRLHIGHDEIGYRYEISDKGIHIRLSDEGPDEFKTELVLPSRVLPRQVLVNGAQLSGDEWRVQADLLHIIVPGHGTRVVEVVR